MTEINPEKEVLNVPSKHLPIQPLTRTEMEDAARARVSLIAREFTEGFNFLEHYPKSVTFFGGSRWTETNPYYMKARSIGEKIVRELGYSVITGGGPGIMEAANRGAFEAGGDSLGLTIELPQHQVTNPYLTKNLDLYYFFSRKVCLSFSAEAYLFFPGGLGTLDEFFEILTLVQTHKIERIPIILVGSDFWNPIDDLLKNELLKLGTIDLEDTQLYTISDDEDQIVEMIRNAPVRNGVQFNYVEPTPTHHEPSEDSEEEMMKKHKLKHCEPCEKKTTPLTHAENEKMLTEIHNWSLLDDESIEKIFDFEDFKRAMNFAKTVGDLAEAEGHHPNICIVDYKHVRISLTTHNIHGLSENDFVMAAKIDDLRRSQ